MEDCSIVLRKTAEITSAQPATASRTRPTQSVSTRPNTAMAAPHTDTATITAQPWRRRFATHPVVTAPISAPTPGAA